MARPRKPDDEIHHNRLSVYLTDDYDRLIRDVAKLQDVPPGVLARRILVAKLNLLSSSMALDIKTSLHV